MKFDRYKVQSKFESYIGCNNPEELKQYKEKFENLQLTSARVNELIEDLKCDSKGCFFKGIHSLCEALSSIEKGNYSWSIVKIYYASFYLIRCLLATEGYSIVKCCGVFILKLKVNEKPKSLKGRGGEHPQIIDEYKKLMSSKDPLLRNTVDGDGKTSIYDYLKEMREIVHYREPFFREPQNDFFENFSSSGEFKEKVKDYFKDYFKDSYNDDMALCFQTPYCLLSAPIFLLNYTNNKLSKFLDKAIILNKEQSDVIKTLILPLGLEQLFKEKCLIY